MTTRKELIERIQAMQLGTQEMLDAAANDATLIPFDTLFVSKRNGEPLWRPKHRQEPNDDIFSVGMVSLVEDWYFYRASELSPMSED